MLHIVRNLLNGSVGVIGSADGPTAVFITGNPNVMEALGIMGKGMLGIFVVMILIALIVYGMGRLGGKKD